jgi:sec-independent protein translocase protein TatC
MALDQVDIDEWSEEEVKSGKKEMGFFDHIDELRKHLIRSILAIVVGAAFFLANKDFVFDYIILGPKSKNFPTYKLFGFYPPDFKVITREMGEVFMVHLQVSIILGLVVAFPFVFWQLWSFIRPALYIKEQNAVKGIVFICSFLFVLGVVFGYFIITPFAVYFLIGYTVDGVEASPTLGSFVNYLTMFTLPTGLIFELPIVVYFLSMVGIVTATLMREYRRHAVVVILLIAGIITPPDPFSIFLVAIPLYILYEISILIADKMEKKNTSIIPLGE